LIENCLIRAQISIVKLSVIIVNYNVKYFLEHCLNSVSKACNNIEAEIVVVDNASTDGSRSFLENRFPNVRFIWNESNLGFSKANNQALNSTTGEHTLFLNPDTIVPEDCFEKCIDFFAKHADCGAIGVKMIDGSGNFLKESKRSFPTPAASFYKLTGLHKLFPASKRFAAYYAGHLSDSKTSSIEVLSGAFMMLSDKMLKRVKGFDEDFFMYGEDIDLSFRIKKTGFKNYYFAETTIIHFKGESTQKNNPEYAERFYGAMKLFVQKHYRDNKWQQKLLLMAIASGKKIAEAKRQLNEKFHTHLIKLKPPEMIQQIRFSEIPFIISGRITANNLDKNPHSGNINQILQIIEKDKIDYLLCCENELTYKDIIELFEKHNKQTEFLIHAQYCLAIIGSSDKASIGITILNDNSEN
jgi:GT2 family glycosyltransferase